MRAKKHLGQHFLTAPAIAQAVADAAAITERDAVLEIGPGTGILTEALIARAGKVIAIEKDERMIPVLRERFSEAQEMGRLEVHEGDALSVLPEALGLAGGKYVLAANIPYYITGEILRFYLSGKVKPSRMALLVQKEVAERVVAKDGKESILSLSVKAYGVPRYIQTVKAGSFSPPPKVDSAILAIVDIGTEKLRSAGENRFFALVRAGFAQKRKLLRRNLEAAAAPEAIEHAFAACGISPDTRAEDVPFEKWRELAEKLGEEKS